MKRLIRFGFMLFFLIAIAQWGLGFLALFGAEYRLYKMRDPLADIQYVMKVARTFDSVDRMLTSFGIADSGVTERLSNSEPLVCKFESQENGENGFEFNVSIEDCQYVEISGRRVAIVYVEYPSMKIVKSPGGVNDSLVVFRMTHVSTDRYDEEAIIKDLASISNYDGVEYYQVGKFVEGRFIGGDGRGVYVSRMLNTTSVKRLFDNGLRVQYQYSNVHVDVKKMDEFVLSFLKKTIAK